MDENNKAILQLNVGYAWFKNVFYDLLRITEDNMIPCAVQKGMLGIFNKT